jgi:hypothetical protein
MCRNIKTLFNFDPPATDKEIRDASVQFVRKLSGYNAPSKANKLSGYNAPSKANEEVFNAAIDEVFDAANRLLTSLETNAPPKDREIEAAKAKARSAERFGKPAEA